MRLVATIALCLLAGAAGAAEAGFLFDILPKAPYRDAWARLMKDVQPTPDWLLRFSKDYDGMSGQGASVTIDGKPYELYYVCEPQHCATRRFEALFEAGGKRAYGALGFEGAPPAFYGDPTPAMQEALSKALKG